MKRSCVLSLALLFLIAPAWGSELSIVGGLAPVEDLFTGGTRIDLRNFALGGIRYEKEFLWFLGFENNVMYAARMLQPKPGEGSQGLYWTSNLVLNLPYDRIVPNLVLGLGAMHRFGDSFPDSGASFLTNWGFGVKFRELAGPIGLRVDYRRLQIRSVESQRLLLQELSGGIVFQF